jgi:hypothetical protein
MTPQSSITKISMNKTSTILATVAILAALTLVLGGIFSAMTTTQSAFAFRGKGNTITFQFNEQHATVSGHDKHVEQCSSNGHPC